MAFYCYLDAARTGAIRDVFARELPEVEFLSGDLDAEAAARVRHLLCWQAPEGLKDRFPALEIIFSSGAGVEQFLETDIPSQVRIVRMTEPGLDAGICYTRRAVPIPPIAPLSGTKP
jgi:glyoxylate/hydroxypyruvate reductase A